MKLSFETRPAYVFIGVRGAVDAPEAAELRQATKEQVLRHETSRALIDLRDAELTREARDELLELARAPDASATAVVTPDELFAAEVNMASLAAGTRARAFTLESDGHRWMSRGSMIKTAVEIPSGHPRLGETSTQRDARRRALLEPPPRTVSTLPPGAPPRKLALTRASELPTPVDRDPRKR